MEKMAEGEDDFQFGSEVNLATPSHRDPTISSVEKEAYVGCSVPSATRMNTIPTPPVDVAATHAPSHIALASLKGVFVYLGARRAGATLPSSRSFSSSAVFTSLPPASTGGAAAAAAAAASSPSPSGETEGARCHRSEATAGRDG